MSYLKSIANHSNFKQQKWNELIDFSGSTRSGNRFFLLQARTGIAYYNLKNTEMLPTGF